MATKPIKTIKGYVVVGRLDNSKRVEVTNKTIIQEALVKAGIELGSNEVIQDIDSNEHALTEKVELGKGYYLVQRVKSM